MLWESADGTHVCIMATLQMPGTKDTPLTWAIANKHAELAQQLIKKTKQVCTVRTFVASEAQTSLHWNSA